MLQVFVTVYALYLGRKIIKTISFWAVLKTYFFDIPEMSFVGKGNAQIQVCRFLLFIPA